MAKIPDGQPLMQEELSIHDKFQRDKDATVAATEAFLQTDPPVIGPHDYRQEALDLVSQGDLTQALQKLERLRDEKSGIVMHEVTKDGVPVVIRDARKAKVPAVRETEAFEMQYLNAIRAGMDIAEIEGKPELKEELQQKATQFMEKFSVDNSAKSQKELAKELKKGIKDLVKTLEKSEVADAYNKLNVAKDFQNFNDKHANVVTVSSFEKESKESAMLGVQQHIVVEAEVAQKGLTDDQKAQYGSILRAQGGEPSWYTAMPKWEQALCKGYAAKIIAGEHVIPTQLRQIAGMKNAFEKVTGIFAGGELEILNAAKHAGTLASLARDEGVRQDVADDNARQAQEWVGQSTQLHCNTYNSRYVGNSNDRTIVTQTVAAMQHVDGKETNTAFNFARYLGPIANVLGGAKDTLNELSECFKDKEFKKIKSHVEPKGFFGRLFRTGSAEKEIERLLKNNKIDKATAKILKEAVDLRRSIEKGTAGDLLTGDNTSLAISTKLNKLTTSISGLHDTPKGMSQEPKQQAMLNMCASGKDRTGLAMHEQSAQAIAERTGIDIKEIDKRLLASGHTAQQAGSVVAGGGSIGNHGTKKENKIGLSRKGQKPIMEVTAQSNKIEGKSKVKEPEGKVYCPLNKGQGVSVKPVMQVVVEAPAPVKSHTKLKEDSPPVNKSHKKGALKPPPTPKAVGGASKGASAGRG